MSHFLFQDDDEAENQIDIDQLFEKRQQRDLKQLSIYNKILNRIHGRIKRISRGKSDTHIFYNVPEFIFGEQCYDNKDCTGYLVAKLGENGFLVRYIHPNTLFISWKQWIPAYVRDEIRKKTGVVLDEKGNVVKKKSEQEEVVDEDDINAGLFNQQQGSQEKAKKEYNDISEYKPTGKLVYNPEILAKIEKKANY
jgi:hypothetical protein